MFSKNKDNKLINFSKRSLNEIETILSEDIILTEDVLAIEKIINKRLENPSENDAAQLLRIKTMLTTIDRARKFNTSLVDEIKQIKADYEKHPANCALLNPLNIGSLPGDIKLQIVSFFSIQERKILTQVSKYFLEMVNLAPILEDYIFFKMLNGAISTKYLSTIESVVLHCTRDQLKDKISALSEEDKALCIKKTYEYHYQSGEESRNTYKIIIPLILVIPVLIMIELFSSHSCTNEDMLDLSCYFNIMKVSVGIAALLLIAYSFHIIFGSSYYASHQSQRTENFFDSVARSNSNEMAHSEAISLIG